MAEEVKKQKAEAGAPKWMTTFADLMSLLMCFFVLLLSFSEMDRQKFKQVAGSMEKAFGMQREIPAKDSLTGTDIISTEFKTIPVSIQITIIQSILEEKESGIVDVDYGPEGMILRVKGGVAFESGKAEIRDQFKVLLDKLGKVFAELDVNVLVSGHTDNIPLREGAEYGTNWRLSAARAVTVVEYFSEKYKISPERLSATGFADGQPLVENDTAERRARNRRVEFKIRPNSPNLVFDGVEVFEPGAAGD